MSYQPDILLTVGKYFTTTCPKCGSTSNWLEHWGEQICGYEKCDGHKYTVNFTTELAIEMLKHIEKMNRIEANRPKPSPPRKWNVENTWLWKTPTGVRLVDNNPRY